MKPCTPRELLVNHTSMTLKCGLNLEQGHAGKCRGVLVDDIIVMWLAPEDLPESDETT